LATVFQSWIRMPLCMCVLSSSALGSWKFSIQTHIFQILDLPVANKVEAATSQTTRYKTLGSKCLLTVHTKSFRREGITHYDECAGKWSCFIQDLSIYYVTLTNWWCHCFFSLQTIIVLSWFRCVCCVFMCVYAVYSHITHFHYLRLCGITFKQVLIYNEADTT
jgi:hypothetical protein